MEKRTFSAMRFLNPQISTSIPLSPTDIVMHMTERAVIVYCNASVVAERKLPNEVRTGGLVKRHGGGAPWVTERA